MLADRGAAAGWSPEEVAEALIELAHNNWFAIDANRQIYEEPIGGAVIRARKLH
ncbi:hypothetical protein [Ensifer sp. 1H6]|uniref:hypothetical protein n=1 Tax=Ensifer sp. 1H6 TaxID=1911585 RepID=UPI001AECE97A|nr:hypothetical protein [Ensifer sp. 1H6]